MAKNKRQSKLTTAEKQIRSFILKRNPSLSSKEVLEVLTGIRRFVNVTRRIYTEPQAIVTYKDKKDSTGKNEKIRTFITTLSELKKIDDNTESDFLGRVRKLHKTFTKNG